MDIPDIDYTFCITDNIIIGSKALNLNEKIPNCTNIGELILHTFSSNVDFIGQVDTETKKKTKFFQMRNESVRCALWMREKGIQPNDVIMICTNNHLDAYIPFLAALYIGAVVSPLDPHIFEENVNYFLEQIKPTMIFIDANLYLTLCCTQQFRLIKGINEIILFSDECMNKLKEIEKRVTILKKITRNYSSPAIKYFRCAEVTNMNSTAIKLFTLGRTASPVPVEIPHLAFMAPSDQHAPYMRKNDTALLFESLCFINGIFITIQAILLNVKIIRTKMQFDVEMACKIIEKYKVTWAFLETSTCYQLSKCSYLNRYYDLSSLKKVIFSGSADYSDKIHEGVQSLLSQAAIFQAYSLTKTGIIAYQRKRMETGGKTKSSGYVSANVQLKIIDTHPLKPQKLGPGEGGEICCFSPYMMKNQELLDGWLKTGDVGYYDQDGDIFVKTRMNEVLHIQSETEIYSASFEEALYNHRAVFEAAVTFIYDQDENRYAIAFIRSTPRSEVTEEELKQHMIEELGSNNQLQHVIFLQRLPRFSNGKINRKLLFNIARSDMFW